MLLLALERHKIPFVDSSGQGHDNDSNMRGRIKGIKTRTLEK
jgi:hypothetical protein